MALLLVCKPKCSNLKQQISSSRFMQLIMSIASAASWHVQVYNKREIGRVIVEIQFRYHSERHSGKSPTVQNAEQPTSPTRDGTALRAGN